MNALHSTLSGSSSSGQAPIPHVNVVWPTLASVPFARLPDNGCPVIVQSYPAGNPSCYLSQQVIRTRAFDDAGEPTKVRQACPHFETLKMCYLGDACNFVHVASIDPAQSSLMQMTAILALQQQSREHNRQQLNNLIAALSAMNGTPLPHDFGHTGGMTALHPAVTQAPFGMPLFAHQPGGGMHSGLLGMGGGDTTPHHPVSLAQPGTGHAPLSFPAQTPYRGDSTTGPDHGVIRAPSSTASAVTVKQGGLRFSHSRQRKGNKPVDVPPPAEEDTEPGPRQLIIHYLAPRIDASALMKLFEQYGAVEDCHVINDARTGVSRGIALLTYRRCADATLAVDGGNGKVLLGKRIRVAYLTPQRPMSDLRSLSAVATELDTLLQPADVIGRVTGTECPCDASSDGDRGDDN